MGACGCVRGHASAGHGALHRAFDLGEAYHDAGARAEVADLLAHVYNAVADVHRRDDPQAHTTTPDLLTCVRRAVAELPRGQRAAKV